MTKLAYTFRNTDWYYEYYTNMTECVVKYLSKTMEIEEEKLRSLIKKGWLYFDDYFELSDFGFDEDFEEFALDYYEKEAVEEYNKKNDTDLKSFAEIERGE